MVEQDDRCGVWTERHRRCRCECRRWWLNDMRRLFRWDWLGLTALVFRRTIRLTHATFLEIQETQPACFNVLRWYLVHAPAPTSFGLGIKGFSVHTAAHDCQLAVLVVRVAGQIPAKPHDLVHCGQFVVRHMMQAIPQASHNARQRERGDFGKRYRQVCGSIGSQIWQFETHTLQSRPCHCHSTSVQCFTALEAAVTPRPCHSACRLEN